MSKNLLLIVNPKSGRCNIQKKIPKIKKNFENQGYTVDIIYTRKDYSPKDILGEYNKKVHLIICCGGDGTLNSLINAIMQLEYKPKVSFIPLGTMNDFAKTIKLSTNKFFLSKNISKSKIVKSDIGLFNEKYFNYVAAFGAFTMVPYVTPQKLKKAFGKLAYFIVAVKYFSKIKNYKIEIEIDNKKINCDCIYGSVSNSKTIGGFQWFRKRDISISDGKYEVLLVKKPKNAFGFVGIAFNILLKKYNSKFFYYSQGSNIEIRPNKSIKWTLDRRIWWKSKKCSN